MIERKLIGVSVTSELHGLIRDLASTGRHGSMSELARACLRLAQERNDGVRHRAWGLAGAPKLEGR